MSSKAFYLLIALALPVLLVAGWYEQLERWIQPEHHFEQPKRADSTPTAAPPAAEERPSGGDPQATRTPDAPPIDDQRAIAERRDHASALWREMLPELDHALETKEELARAPEAALFTTDKGDLRERYARILEGMGVLLEDQELAQFRRQIAERQEEMTRTREQIGTLREARRGAPLDGSWLNRSRDDYDAEIARLERRIPGIKSEIDAIHRRLGTRLQEIGIHLTSEQVEQLLARVDGDNLLQLVSVYENTRSIVEQLEILLIESREDVEYAKRYYGMYVVLLELVLYLQDRHLLEIDHAYLPKLQELTQRTARLRLEAIQNAKSDPSLARQRGYQANVEAHQLTLETARLYGRLLNQQRGQMAAAREEVERGLALARNTLETVLVSAELIHSINAGQETFEALSQLPIPNLIAFENAQVRRKFEELSELLAQ